MLTDHEDIIEVEFELIKNQVPCEETVNEILERYKEINEHAASCTGFYKKLFLCKLL